MQEGKYYHTKASVEEYIRMAQDVDGAALIEQLRRVLPAKSSVLELGSGPGSDWKILSQSYQVTGSDNSAEFLAHLQATYPAGEFLELDAAKLETTRKFAGIYSNKVLHHLNDMALAASVARQAALLTPEGIVCHSFWKGEGDEVFKGMYVNYHTEAELRDVFAEHFALLSVTAYAEFEDGDSLLLIGKRR